MSAEYNMNDSGGRCYIDVSAILAGAFLALAISGVLSNFGAAIGLAVSAEHGWTGNTALIGIIVTGAWILWIQLLASLSGGYLSGRMRRPVAGALEHEREIRDGAHGLLVWTVCTVAVAIGVGLMTALAAFAPDLPEAADTVTQTPEMVERARNTAIIFAFVTAAASFVSAAAAWWAATVGGEHRDKSVDHSRFVSFRKR